MKLTSPSVARIPAHRARRMRAASWVLVVLALVVPMLSLGSTPDVLFAAFTLGVGTFVAAIALATWYRGEALVGRRYLGASTGLEVDARGVRLPWGTVTDADVVECVHEEYGARHQVLVRLSRETLAIETDGADDALAILDALGVRPFQRAVILQVGRATGVVARLSAVALVSLGVAVSLPLNLIFLALLLVSVRPIQLVSTGAVLALAWAAFLGGSRLLATRALRIAREGISTRVGLRPAQFVPYRGMVLERRGRLIAMHAGVAASTLHAASEAQAVALFARIDQARADFDARSAMRAELLARQGRPLDAWREGIRKLALADGYREGLGRDELIAILEDPSALPDERIAAASALGAIPDDARVKQRVASAIRAVPEQRLRVALEHALDGALVAPERADGRDDLVERRRAR
jgi:hypothetical protein